MGYCAGQKKCTVGYSNVQCERLKGTARYTQCSVDVGQCQSVFGLSVDFELGRDNYIESIVFCLGKVKSNTNVEFHLISILFQHV